MTPPTRFQFPLQRVLELRAQHEQAVAARLADASSDTDRARAAMAAIAAVRAAGSDALARANAAATSVGHLRQMAFVLDQVDAHLEHADSEVRAREATEAVVRTEHQVAMQLRRTIDRLREKREDEWRRDVKRADQATMDALATTRHLRKDGAADAQEPAA